MKRIFGRLRHNWRHLVSSIFVLTVFMMPATRGILARFFQPEVEAGGRHNQNHQTSRSQTVRSVTCPDSNNTASPMQNTRSTGTGSNGTGHTHSREHHQRHPRHR